MLNSEPDLFLKQVYGSSCGQNIANPAFFASEDGSEKICYVAGAYLISRSKGEEQKANYQLTELGGSSLGFAVSPGRTRIASLNSSLQTYFFRIFTLASKGWNIYPSNLYGKSIRFFQFLSESELAIALSPPEVVVIGVDEGSKINVNRVLGGWTEITELRCQGGPDKLLTVLGKSHFLLFRLEDYELRLVENLYDRSTVPVAVHCWLKGAKAVALVDKSKHIKVYFLNKDSIASYVGLAQEEEGEQHLDIKFMAASGKIIVLGTKDCRFLMFRLEGAQLTEVGRWDIGEERKSDLGSMHLDGKTQQLLVGLKSNDVATVELPLHQESLKFDFIHKGSHHGPINSLECSLHAPFFLTCASTDSTIRIWNILSMECRLVRQFASKDKFKKKQSNLVLNCASLHASGLYLALGFCDKVILYYLLKDSLKPYRQIALKGPCRTIKFSRGGHLLAIVVDRGGSHSGFNLLVYRAFERTLQFSTILPQRVSSLLWSENDKKLFVLLESQWVFCWSNKVSQFRFVKSLRLLAGAIDQTRLAVSCIEKDKSFIKWLAHGLDGEEEFSFINSLSLDFKVSSLCCTSTKLGSVYYAGCQDGSIRCFKQNEVGTLSVLKVLRLQSMPIIKLAIIECGKLLVAGGQQGIAFVLSTCEKGVDENSSLDQQLGKIALYQCGAVENLQKQLWDLQHDIESLEGKLQDHANQEWVKLQFQKNRMQEQLNRSTQLWEQKFQDLRSLLDKSEKESVTLIRNQDFNYKKTIQELQMLYACKLSNEHEARLDLEDRLNCLRVEMQQLKQQLKCEMADKLSSQGELYKGQVDKLQKQLQIAKKYILELEEEEEDKVECVVEQNSAETLRLKARFKDELDSRQREWEDKAAHFEYQQTSFRAIRNELKAKNNFIAAKQKQIQTLTAEVALLRVQNMSMKLLARAKNETIKSLKMRVKELEVGTGDLTTKLKLFQHNGRTLSQVLESKQMEIAAFTKKLAEMDEFTLGHNRQLKQLRQAQQTQSLMIERLKAQKAQAQQLAKSNQLKFNNFYLECFRATEQAMEKQREVQVKEVLKKVLQKYSSTDRKLNDIKTDMDAQRQVQVLQNELRQLRSKSEKLLQIKENEIVERRKQNSTLIQELNLVRKEKRYYFASLESKSKRLKKAENEIQKLDLALLTGGGRTQRSISQVQVQVTQERKVKTQLKYKRNALKSEAVPKRGITEQAARPNTQAAPAEKEDIVGWDGQIVDSNYHLQPKESERTRLDRALSGVLTGDKKTR